MINVYENQSNTLIDQMVSISKRKFNGELSFEVLNTLIQFVSKQTPSTQYYYFGSGQAFHELNDSSLFNGLITGIVDNTVTSGVNR